MDRSDRAYKRSADFTTRRIRIDYIGETEIRRYDWIDESGWVYEEMKRTDRMQGHSNTGEMGR